MAAAVIDAVLTGYSNAKAEAHNRTAKLTARTAADSQPQNQARRVRMATTEPPSRPPEPAAPPVTESSQGRSR